jgi:AraC family transcriptional regulator
MTSHCCVRVVKMDLEAIGVKVVDIRIGEVVVEHQESEELKKLIETTLEDSGFRIIKNQDKKLVEKIKMAVIDMVHNTTYNAMVRNSDFLVGKFNKSYQHLSSIFSKHEGITLEKFIINKRIEKVKSMIFEGEMSLSEIAFITGYSSVQYLSTHFKSISGISVTEFKTDPIKYMSR